MEEGTGRGKRRYQRNEYNRKYVDHFPQLLRSQKQISPHCLTVHQTVPSPRHDQREDYEKRLSPNLYQDHEDSIQPKSDEFRRFHRRHGIPSKTISRLYRLE